MSTSIREREGAHDAYAQREGVASARTTHGRALAINGKYASQRMTGVQRGRDELNVEATNRPGSAHAVL
ncbi:hypothetical protein OIV42_31675, partial [Burkholderia pseudomallei]|nr:hypothetical protein [Burkholderia pseudomallei]